MLSWKAKKKEAGSKFIVCSQPSCNMNSYKLDEIDASSIMDASNINGVAHLFSQLIIQIGY